MDIFPVQLRLKGRAVLLVGDGDAAAAKARLLEAAGAHIVRDEHAQAQIAIIALPMPQAAAVADRLRARGILINVVDQPSLCDFLIPAFIDRSPVIVAVGSSGASASLARHLRERLEAILPPTLGNLARTIASRRASLTEHLPTAPERRRFWDGLLAQGAPLDPLSDIQNADVIIDAALAQSMPNLPEPIDIWIESEDPDDLRLRDLRALQSADILIVDPDVAPNILDRARRDAVRVAAGASLDTPTGIIVRVRRAAR
jgi:uroporphyrin-III C-methyltransferase / precorrin-2 dehydrogenase / sirohydrochlorin ferrochelatase